MPLNPGTRLGPHEILAPLGAGGMGEVYRARDTRLDRTVAIKVMPPHLATDPQLRQRFEREARAVSSLSHPHICALYDIGHQDGVDYLVMEYLEGQTLAERLKQGPLPADQALRCAMEMADALDKAHRQGVVHRDLKPGNIMLTKAGAKLLDFGLAKTAGLSPNAPDAATSPTLAKALTAQGTIVGTFQYMAPEQLEGQEADARSDIFAFGAVLYEMLTGRRAFDGKSQASVIAAILNLDPPPALSVQPMTPPALDRVVRIAMAKDPDDRFQTAHDLKLQLDWIAEGGSQAGVAAPVAGRRKLRERLLWALASVALLALGVTSTLLLTRAPQNAERLQVALLAPEDYSFDAFDFALSPDGKQVAFVAMKPGAKPQLWVRRLDSASAQPLAGTEGATEPFWSPDGRDLGFFAEGKLKRIEASGGPVQSLASAVTPRGGAWSSEGVIVFAPSPTDPLYRVPATGGEATHFTKLDAARSETSHRWPQFLPDGKHFLFLAKAAATNAAGRKEDTSGSTISVASLDSPTPKQITRAEQRGRYAGPGWLLFLRGANLMAQRFDAKSLEVSGEPVPIAEGIVMDARWNSGFTVSDEGKLILQVGSVVGSELVWYDRSGKRGNLAASGSYNVPRLSPDGFRLAASENDATSGTLDIWTYDLARGVRSRFTFDPSDDDDPVWSPDGRMVAFDSARKGHYDIYWKPVDASRPEELLYEDKATKYVTSWSKDGKYILFDRSEAQGKTRSDVWVLQMEGERKAFPYLQTPTNENLAVFSPDGKWVAYVSDESGRSEVYVSSFPEPTSKHQVSNGGGDGPQWRGDGKELYYMDPENRITVVEIRPSGGRIEMGLPRPLIQVRLSGQFAGYSYNVVRDGNRFLVLETPERKSSSLTLIVNWPAALKK